MKGLGLVVRGGSPRPAGDPRFFGGDYVPWLTVAAITQPPDHQSVISKVPMGLTEEGALRSRTLLPGAVVIANSGATLGVAKLLDVRCCANDGVAALLGVERPLALYISRFINTLTDQLREVVASGNGQPNLNTTLIGNLEIRVPPRREVVVINSAFDDIDDLTAGLDALIVKKRAVKEAVMQRLLTGRQRLPGFDGEWKVVPFGDLTRPERSRLDPRTDASATMCIELEHIESGTGRLLGSTTLGKQGSIKAAFEPGDVLFGKLRAYLRKYWRSTTHGTCSTEMWVLRADVQRMSSDYLYHLVTTASFIEAASTTQGTHMPRSDWNSVRQYEVHLPPVDEQVAIAEALTAMDAEIKALAASRDKARLVKRGMAQELLTGRTRLV